MRLVKIQMQGFKSFADHTDICFDAGLTVLVGPNGCGKSNISDAVRWVLGEPSIRNLRAQKAEDIIFSGSDTRKPKNSAEVTMVLDNSDRELPVDTAEVSVTRRLLRNGDSEFFLNRRSCRMKDIQELFANTGLGRGSLAIIGQNRVDQVLSARPEERRIIFEEAAGISRYRMRKLEGLRKLEATDQNMDRLRDMAALLDEQLSPMKESAQKAHTLRKLQKERRSLAVTAVLLHLSSQRRMLSRYENEYRILNEEEADGQIKLTACEADRLRLGKEADSRELKVRKAAGEASEQKQHLEKLRGDFRVMEEALHHALSEGERLEEEHRNAVSRKTLLTAKKQGLKKQEEESRTGLAAIRLELQKSEEKKAECYRGKKEAEEASADLREKQQRTQEEKIRLESQREQGRQEQARSEEQIVQARKRCVELKSSVQSAEAGLKDIGCLEIQWRKRAEEAEVKSREIQCQLDLLEKEAEKNNRDRIHGESILLQTVARRKYLEKMDQEYASFSNTVKTILQSRETWRQHVMGPVGELIQVPSEYAAAIEVALGGSLSYVVTDTSESAGQIIRWLQSHRAGRTTFYPLDAIRGKIRDEEESRVASEKGICGIAEDLVSCSTEYRPLCSYLLGRVLVAETLEDALAAARRFRYRYRFVTLDGQVVNAGGSMTGGSLRKKENTFFGRKQEIQNLLEEEKRLQSVAEKLGEKDSRSRENLKKLTEKLSVCRKEGQDCRMQRASLQGQYEGAERALAAKQDQYRRIREEEDELVKRRDRFQHLAETAEQSIRDMVQEGVSLDGQSFQIWDERCRSADQEVVELKIRLTREESQMDFCQTAAREAEETETAQTQLIKTLEERMKEAGTESERVQTRMAEMKAQFVREEEKWNSLSLKEQAIRGESDQFLSERQKVEKDWRQMQDASAARQKQIADREGRITAFKDQIARELERLNEWHMDEHEAESCRMEGSISEIQSYLSDTEGKIADLGSVNPNGEEEYQEVLKRRDFYQTQIEDLMQARKGLEAVIREIDATMDQQFRTAFQAVDQEFRRIVQIMFQGGQGKLILTDEKDVLQGGVEIFLQLPGKRQQPLTLLSGGERALAVIALLIAFLACRPAPFCFVDEIDAALDDANVERLSRMIAEYKKKTQFIVISHRKKTMEAADTLQGVTMGEKGVSSLITVRVEDYIKEA